MDSRTITSTIVTIASTAIALAMDKAAFFLSFFLSQMVTHNSRDVERRRIMSSKVSLKLLLWCSMEL